MKISFNIAINAAFCKVYIAERLQIYGKQPSFICQKIISNLSVLICTL